MRKLSAIVFGSLVFIGTAGANCETRNPDYFLEGGSSDYVIRISFDRKTLLDISQLNILQDCPGSAAKLCFISKALTFSSEPTQGAAAWTVDGLEFKMAGICASKVCQKMKVELNVIHSSRYGNDIDFYYDDACGLMGWTMTSPKDGSETYMQLPPREGNEAPKRVPEASGSNDR
jgi:hypothetical protein